MTATSTSFSLTVVAANGVVDPTLNFDTGPVATILDVGTQTLAPSGTTRIDYQVVAIAPLVRSDVDGLLRRLVRLQSRAGVQREQRRHLRNLLRS